MSKAALVFLASLVLFMGLAHLPGPEASGEEGDATTEPTYVGAKSCKLCHFKHYKSWKKTGMAKAFESLKPGHAAEKKRASGLDPDKDYTRDASCLACHTTAYGTPHGYPALESGSVPTAAETARMAANEGVNCEACHGPGSLYKAFKRKNKQYKRSEIVELGAIAPVTAQQCASCHRKGCPTMPDDYQFDFDGRVDEVHVRTPLKYPH